MNVFSVIILHYKNTNATTTYHQTNLNLTLCGDLYWTWMFDRPPAQLRISGIARSTTDVMMRAASNILELVETADRVAIVPVREIADSSRRYFYWTWLID